MNFFTLLTIAAGSGAVISFVCGMKAIRLHGRVGHRSAAEWMSWHFVFEVATFVTILTAPLSIAG